MLIKPTIRGARREAILAAAHAGRDPAGVDDALDGRGLPEAHLARVIEYDIPDRAGYGTGELIVLLTTISDPGAARADELAEAYHLRREEENIIGQLKSGINALHAPVDDLHSNWAYMLIAALAWNIKSWHAMMMHCHSDRHAFIRMEFKQFLHTVIRIPATVIVRARAIVVRLVAYTVNIDRFFTAWATTERTRLRSPATGYG